MADSRGCTIHTLEETAEVLSNRFFRPNWARTSRARPLDLGNSSGI